MHRRSFIQLAAAAALGSRCVPAESPAPAVLRVGEKVVASMPRDFTGISIESPQLYNPE